MNRTRTNSCRVARPNTRFPLRFFLSVRPLSLVLSIAPSITVALQSARWGGQGIRVNGRQEVCAAIVNAESR
jgi:hypothetical protein